MELKRNVWRTRNVLPGGGPWRIDPGCPSKRLHNTLRSTKQRMEDGRCICPQAAALAAVEQAGRAERRAAEKAAMKRREGAAIGRADKPRARRLAGDGTDRVISGDPWATINDAPFMHNVVPNVERPDLSRGLCTATKPGREAAMAVFDVGRPESIARMRRICDHCPILADCDRWVTANESPAGSWRGMYAGKTARERAGGEISAAA